MSVMFEILERLESKGGNAAVESVAQAFPTIHDRPPKPERTPESMISKAASVSGDLNNLLQLAFKRLSSSSLLDIRFDGQRGKPGRSAGGDKMTDFASLWAMARLGNAQSLDSERNTPKE